MMDSTRDVAILLLSCKDRAGLVSRISHFFFKRGGNIVDLDEHVSGDEGVFSIRVAWELARISHKAATAAADLPALTAFRSVGLLDVLSSTTARASVARPCQGGLIRAA
jgi:formyltetrahydrofolate hydrolase